VSGMEAAVADVGSAEDLRTALAATESLRESLGVVQQAPFPRVHQDDMEEED
jgi:hypothetical protein